ncbi:hypothetical protein M3P05_13585 [Sansalvadorimonas sp. 2012CJ34-2]|uniref:Uncharacterized protein n=1 Tax=Parendozoicomonas callyspongiae TaxID=2942213 RepID=A0ABT0PHV1_9GAMM|nr:hypothetical protein [Sansalvadorimonas sp. 2012CJ34-2]MCL6270957.1 hypothetical protein [Sansalvadorimonas sp. 2012CJ34-2]
MSSSIVSRTDHSFTLQIEASVSHENMLVIEDNLQQALNEGSRLLKELDAAELPRKTTALIEKRHRAVTYLKNNLS